MILLVAYKYILAYPINMTVSNISIIATIVVLVIQIVLGFSLECHFGKEEHYKYPEEVREQTSGGIKCVGEHHLCARVHFRAVQEGSGRLVYGHQASCLNISECADSKACALNLLKDMSFDGDGLEITRCKTICCEGNMCNHHNSRAQIDYASTTRERLQCIDGQSSFDDQGVIQSKQSVKMCSHSSVSSHRLDMSSRCHKVVVTATNIVTKEKSGTALYGCIDAEMCISGCKMYRDVLAQMEANPKLQDISCEASCCREDLCNFSSHFKHSTILLGISISLTMSIIFL